MKIDGKNVDPRAVVAWKATLEPTSSVEIVDFVTATPALQFGFRPGKISPQVAIERVKGIYNQGRSTENAFVFPGINDDGYFDHKRSV